jgi:putative membrane protein
MQSTLADIPMILRDRPAGIKLFFILRGSIFPRILGVLAVNIFVASVVTALHVWHVPFGLTLTPVPFTLIGLALAIFLGFRNTAAYDRFWEGRKLWGQLVTECRNLARECQTLITADHPASMDTGLQDVRVRMIFRAIAFAHNLRQLLRDSADRDQLKTFLADEEWKRLETPAENLNILMLQMGRDVSQCLKDRRIDGPIAAAINGTLSSMVSAATGCERIKNTPIPFSYSLLLHRTAYLYCFLLPFGLVDSTVFMTPIVVAIVAYTFFGLDALGDEIEEPFGMSDNDLPLDAICRMIEHDLRKAVGDPQAPSGLAPVDFRLT